VKSIALSVLVLAWSHATSHATVWTDRAPRINDAAVFASVVTGVLAFIFLIGVASDWWQGERHRTS
jgi:hypothetical protein